MKWLGWRLGSSHGFRRAYALHNDALLYLVLKHTPSYARIRTHDKYNIRILCNVEDYEDNQVKKGHLFQGHPQPPTANSQPSPQRSDRAHSRNKADLQPARSHRARRRAYTSRVTVKGRRAVAGWRSMQRLKYKLA